MTASVHGSRLARVRQMGLRNFVRVSLVLGRRRAWSVVYTLWLRACGVRVGRGVRFAGRIHVIGDPRRITIGDGCSLHRGVTLWTHAFGSGRGEIVLGRRITMLHNVTLNSWERIEVGDESAFGDGCYVQDNDHGMEPGTPIMRQPCHGAPITIGSDVWFGARCMVLKGVSVGDGTVVGGGSVVVKSLPAGVVAVGVPCRPIKRRGGGAPIEEAVAA